MLRYFQEKSNFKKHELTMTMPRVIQKASPVRQCILLLEIFDTYDLQQELLGLVCLIKRHRQSWNSLCYVIVRDTRLLG